MLDRRGHRPVRRAGEAIQNTGRRAVKRSKEAFGYAAAADTEDARAYEAEVW